MSLTSWKKEFYPVTAKKCSKQNALQHSIRKWTGLLKANLKKHGVRLNENSNVQDDNGHTLGIDDSSCALCIHYADYCGAGHPCWNCPLYQIRDGSPCDRHEIDPFVGSEESPFGVFISTGNPRPMLKWLRKALKMQEAAK